MVQSKQSFGRITANFVVPVAFFLLFIITGTIILTYTLYLHMPVPQHFTVGVSIGFGSLISLFLTLQLCYWCGTRYARQKSSRIVICSKCDGVSTRRPETDVENQAEERDSERTCKQRTSKDSVVKGNETGVGPAMNLNRCSLISAAKKGCRAYGQARQDFIRRALSRERHLGDGSQHRIPATPRGEHKAANLDKVVATPMGGGDTPVFHIYRGVDRLDHRGQTPLGIQRGREAALEQNGKTADHFVHERLDRTDSVELPAHVIQAVFPSPLQPTQPAEIQMVTIADDAVNLQVSLKKAGYQTTVGHLSPARSFICMETGCSIAAYQGKCKDLPRLSIVDDFKCPNGAERVKSTLPLSPPCSIKHPVPSRSSSCLWERDHQMLADSSGYSPQVSEADPQDVKSTEYTTNARERFEPLSPLSPSPQEISSASTASYSEPIQDHTQNLATGITAVEMRDTPFAASDWEDWEDIEDKVPSPKNPRALLSHDIASRSVVEFGDWAMHPKSSADLPSPSRPRLPVQKPSRSFSVSARSRKLSNPHVSPQRAQLGNSKCFRCSQHGCKDPKTDAELEDSRQRRVPQEVPLEKPISGCASRHTVQLWMLISQSLHSGQLQSPRSSSS